MTAELQAELCMISRLIDLPHYAAIRTHLLQPNKYPALFSALEGLLMILPQGDSYYDLKARLECASLCFDLEDESSTAQQTPEKVDTILQQTEEDPSKYVAMVVEQNLSLFHGLDKEQVLAQLN